MEKLTFTFVDLPSHDTFVIRLGEAGAVLPDAFEREIGARILSATTRYLFAVILENDNGTYLLFVPEKKNSPEARRQVDTKEQVRINSKNQKFL